MQRAIEQATSIMERKVSQKLHEAQELADIAREYEERQSNFEDDIEERRVTLDNFVHNGKLVREFEEKHRSEKEKAKELDYKKATITAEISKLEERKDSLKKQIPSIEMEQKKFAELKNFKAAAMKKAEIKEINDELERIKARIAECLEEEYEYGSALEELKQAQKDILEDENVLQVNLARSQYLFGQAKMRDMEVYLRELEKATSLPHRDKLAKELSGELTRIQDQM